MSVPIPEPQTCSQGWNWLTEAPSASAKNLTWVIDGSRRYACDWALSTTGCGVAGVDEHDVLVAYAHATPPSWVKTASAAEAWALLLTLNSNLDVPRIITDCLGLVNMARAGPAKATTSHGTDARIWREVSDTLGGDFKALRQNLVWMPSHQAAQRADERRKSDGSKLTITQWRANQLAGALAKRAAPKTALRDAADAGIATASEAIVYSAAMLGVVTKAANGQRVDFTRRDGTVGFYLKRDSSNLPKKGKQKTEAQQLAKAKTATPPQLPRSRSKRRTTTGRRAPSESAEPLESGSRRS